MADVPTETQQRPHTAARQVEVDLPVVDMRRKRPPVLAFLLRMETLRTSLRVLSLLVLDFAGVFAAIYVALMVKAVLRYGEWAWAASLDETRNTIAFAYLVTVLLFARSSLYASRAERPGLSRIVSSLGSESRSSRARVMPKRPDWPSRSCSCRRPARRSTSTATSRSAAPSSVSWCGPCRASSKLLDATDCGDRARIRAMVSPVR